MSPADDDGYDPEVEGPRGGRTGRTLLRYLGGLAAAALLVAAWLFRDEPWFAAGFILVLGLLILFMTPVWLAHASKTHQRENRDNRYGGSGRSST